MSFEGYIINYKQQGWTLKTSFRKTQRQSVLSSLIFPNRVFFFVFAELCTTSLNDFSFYMIYDFIFRLVASYWI